MSDQRIEQAFEHSQRVITAVLKERRCDADVLDDFLAARDVLKARADERETPEFEEARNLMTVAYMLITTRCLRDVPRKIVMGPPS